MKGLNKINIYLYFDCLARVFASACNNITENVRQVTQITYEEEVYINGCESWALPNLCTEDRCKKGCIAHEPCRAYYYHGNSGCALCVTEIDESNVGQQPASSDIYIDDDKFEQFVEGRCILVIFLSTSV